MDSKKIVYSGFFIALGIIVPQIFHLIGGPALGGIFLPMHFPVLLAGMLCGPLTGLVTGILAPLLSSVITGMPPVPRLWFMVLELGGYGFISGWMYNKMRMNIFVSLISSMTAGRIIYGIAFTVVVNLFGIALPPGLGLTASLAKGVPGMALQLVIIPIIVTTLERNFLKNDRVRNRKRNIK